MITNTNYYLDLDCLSEFCSIKIDNPGEDENVFENENNSVSAGIDVFKYEIIKMCVDRLVFGSSSKEMESEIMAMKNDSDEDISFDLAFNTLYAHKIIKKL